MRMVGELCGRSDTASGPPIWARVFLPGGQSVLLIDAGDNLWYGGAINLAIDCIDKSRRWRGVWILNPDTQPAPSALEMVVNYAEREGCGLVGSRLVDSVHKTIQMRGGARLQPLIGRSTAWIWRAGQLTRQHGRDRAAARMDFRSSQLCNARLHRDGSTNERQVFPLLRGRRLVATSGLISLGLCARFCSITHRRYDDRAGIGLALDLTIYLSERNRLLLTRDHFPLIYPLTAAVACISLVEYLLRGDLHAFAVGWRGWLAGLRGETGRPERLGI